MGNESGSNREPMRHIPPRQEIIDRVGTGFRRKIELVLAIRDRSELPAGKREMLDGRLLTIATWLERVADLARPPKHHQVRLAADDIRVRVIVALEAAVEALEKSDPAQFGRRAPHHHFAQSGAEPLWQAVLGAGYWIRLLLEDAATIDPDLWWEVLDTSSRDQIDLTAAP